jgi:hypothetical protein
MHIHGNQINPNVQLDASYAAERAAAKREAERTRKKLSQFASALAGEACIVELEAGEDSQGQAKRQNQPRDGNPKKQNQDDSNDADKSISDWA